MDADGLERLIARLREMGHEVIGPTVRDHAIVLEPLQDASQLPIGWTEATGPGRYRLERRGDRARFGFNVGPMSWKSWLYPSRLRMWQARRKGIGFELSTDSEPTPRLALLGARACDLAAIRILDRVLIGGVEFKDSDYAARREPALIVAVPCGQGGETCFCRSMGTGPELSGGFDLALTEVLEDDDPYYVVEAGSARGAEALAGLNLKPADAARIEAARQAPERAARQMGRQLQVEGLKELLADSYENPQWERVAQRCLTCANCTMACPTCFCATMEDATDLSGAVAERARTWDSCFTTDFSYVHGGSVRVSPMSRYRQWLTHKLSTWVDQFGVMGCVGCGRCIAWCPVGIDLTEEARAIRELSQNAAAANGAKEQNHERD
jgi:ferredoxin